MGTTYDKYTYQVAWSADDKEYVASVAEFPSLSWLDSDRAKAEAGLMDLVCEVVQDLLDSGEEVPTPLGERRYSGKFNVRTSPALHRQLVMAAQREGISLNMLVNHKLAAGL
ncbi:MAG: type II toxin-antitoxin system HicB family antitoxin [Corynebacterium sp.]|nr:type II toxin-antitoxin system HicB family antitoxin [Corynebacterium sp.]